MRRCSVFLCAVVEVHLVCNYAGIMDRQTRLVVWVGFYTSLEGKAFKINFAPLGLKFSHSDVCVLPCNPHEKKRRLGRLSFEMEGSEQAGGCHGCLPLFRN